MKVPRGHLLLAVLVVVLATAGTWVWARSPAKVSLARTTSPGIDTLRPGKHVVMNAQEHKSLHRHFGLHAATNRRPFRFFAPDSVWNRPVPASARLAPRSADLIATFDAEIAHEALAKHGPTINTIFYSVPIYTVPANQPTVMVQLVNHSPEPVLQSAWDAVPLPANAQPAAGTDKHLVVWQPSTNRLWEFWRLEQTPTGWQAGWGGAIQSALLTRVPTGPKPGPGRAPDTPRKQASLSIAGGLITLEDLELGQINHALAMAIPNVRVGVYAAPAHRSDGKSTEPLALPEGAHLRLNPNLNLAALHLPRLTLILARAAQRYGIVIRDKASNVTLYAQDSQFPPGPNRTLAPAATSKGKARKNCWRPFHGATCRFSE